MIPNLEGLLHTSSRDTIWRPGCYEKYKIWLESIEWLFLMKKVHVTNMRGHPHECISSVHSVVSNSLQPHGLQHARLPCPPPTPGACSNLCLSSQWCHPTISSSVIPFSCLKSFPTSESFPRVSSSHRVAKVLEYQLQHQSFQWIFRTDFL